jgi:hypothetical protein
MKESRPWRFELSYGLLNAYQYAAYNGEFLRPEYFGRLEKYAAKRINN